MVRPPWQIDPRLSLERLVHVGNLIRSVRRAAMRHLEPENGDRFFGRWVLGTTTHARLAHTITQAAAGEAGAWLSVVDGTLQFTFAIEGIPVRVYTGDANAPSESAMKRSLVEAQAQIEAFDLAEITDPEAEWTWRIAVEPDPLEEDDARLTIVQVHRTGEVRNPFRIPNGIGIAPLTLLAEHRPEGVDLGAPEVEALSNSDEASDSSEGQSLERAVGDGEGGGDDDASE